MLLYTISFCICIIAIYLLSKGNSNPYKKTIPRTFAPLTHLEIIQRKPFIWKLAESESKPAKWVYECNLLETKNLSVLWQNKDAILKTVENSKMKIGLEYVVVYLTKMLYEIGEKPRGIIKRIQYKRYFFKYCYQNIEALIKVFNDMLDYQTRLFFLLKQLKTKIITQEREYIKIDGDLYSQEQKVGPRYISNIFLNWSLPKKESSIKKQPQKKVSQEK